MDMSLVNAGLAAGAALAVVPLILHLLMRQKPKRVVFPALQLIRNRHKQTNKRLRIKNWLLLAARMALVALMAVALARPSLFARVPLGDGEVATAMALVVDTSLSMGYTDAGKTRLEAAKEQGRQLLSRLPDTSQIYLIDSGLPTAPAPVSPAAARKRLDGLMLRAAARPLNESVEQAYAALAGSDSSLPRQEVYVLTDLARTAWEVGRPVAGRVAAEEQSKRGIATFVLRLSPQAPRNAAIVGLTAEPVAVEGAPGDESARLVATVRNFGPAATRIADLIVDGTKRDSQEVQLPADGEAQIAFRSPPSLGPGLHQAEARLQGVDPLPTDDRRFVTFRSLPAHNVLIVYDRDDDDPYPTVDAFFIAKALDPSGLGRPNAVELLGTNQMTGGRFPKDLGSYAGIFLNNVARLSDEAWGQLAGYVQQGGGVVVGLGQHSEPSSYNSAAASQVMPLRLDDHREAPAGRAGFGTILDPSHPLFGELTRELEADLASVPVSRYFGVTLVDAPATRALLTYQDGAPALVERAFAGGPEVGHTLAWTTPLSRRATPGDPDAWNEFPLQGWSFLALMLRTVPYLAGSASGDLNFAPGEFVRLPLPPGQRAGGFLVQGPTPELSQRVSPQPGASDLLIEGAEAVGHWTVTSTGEDAEARPADALGFSVNAPAEESSLTPLEPADLDSLFGGKDGYALAADPSDLKRVQEQGRVGRELYPLIMAMILALITAEGFLANRFHRETPGAASGRVANSAPAPRAATTATR